MVGKPVDGVLEHCDGLVDPVDVPQRAAEPEHRLDEFPVVEAGVDRPFVVRDRLGLEALPVVREGPLQLLSPAHMRKMPNSVSGIGALSAAEIPSASTRRVSSGSMIPSSQSRAVE